MAFSCFIEYLIAKSVNREMKDAKKSSSINQTNIDLSRWVKNTEGSPDARLTTDASNVIPS